MTVRFLQSTAAVWLAFAGALSAPSAEQGGFIPPPPESLVEERARVPVTDEFGGVLVQPAKAQPAFSMTQVVDLGKAGKVEFPADVTRDQIVQAIQTRFPRLTAKVPRTA